MKYEPAVHQLRCDDQLDRWMMINEIKGRAARSGEKVIIELGDNPLDLTVTYGGYETAAPAQA